MGFSVAGFQRWTIPGLVGPMHPGTELRGDRLMREVALRADWTRTNHYPSRLEWAGVDASLRAECKA
jgi:hypothetical protein